LGEYRALSLVEPWGEWRDDYRFAQLLALLFNVNRGKQTKAVTADKLMPTWELDEPETEDQKSSRWLSVIRANCEGTGGTFNG